MTLSMKGLAIAVLVFVCGATTWFFFAEKTDEKDPFLRLSKIFDDHIAQVLGPLDSNAVPIDTHELRKLREALRDGGGVGKREAIELHQAAVKLCDTLLTLLEDREVHAMRVRHILANTNTSELSDSPNEDKERRTKFFVSGVERSWIDRVKAYRKRLDKEYAELRRLERSNSNSH